LDNQTFADVYEAADFMGVPQLKTKIEDWVERQLLSDRYSEIFVQMYKTLKPQHKILPVMIQLCFLIIDFFFYSVWLK
jgi:hypothetical protein